LQGNLLEPLQTIFNYNKQGRRLWFKYIQTRARIF